MKFSPEPGKEKDEFFMKYVRVIYLSDSEEEEEATEGNFDYELLPTDAPIQAQSSSSEDEESETVPSSTVANGEYSVAPGSGDPSSTSNAGGSDVNSTSENGIPPESSSTTVNNACSVVSGSDQNCGAGSSYVNTSENGASPESPHTVVNGESSEESETAPSSSNGVVVRSHVNRTTENGFAVSEHSQTVPNGESSAESDTRNSSNVEYLPADTTSEGGAAAMESSHTNINTEGSENSAMEINADEVIAAMRSVTIPISAYPPWAETIQESQLSDFIFMRTATRPNNVRLNEGLPPSQ